jgi:hypothetical protein
MGRGSYEWLPNKDQMSFFLHAKLDGFSDGGTFGIILLPRLLRAPGALDAFSA